MGSGGHTDCTPTRCLIKADAPPAGPLLCSEEWPRPFPLLPGLRVMGSAGRQPERGGHPASHPSCTAALLSAYLQHLTHFNYGPAGTSGRAGDARDSPEAPAPGATGHPGQSPGAPSPPASTSPPWRSPRRPLLPPGALWLASGDSARAWGGNGPGAVCAGWVSLPQEAGRRSGGLSLAWGLGGDARRAGNAAPTRWARLPTPPPIPMYI